MFYKKAAILKKLNRFLETIIGCRGPVYFDTCLAYHNIFLKEDLSEEVYNALLEQDIITIGIEGGTISSEDIETAKNNFQKKLNDGVFENNRSYFYEGFKCEDNKCSIVWGS
jgi:hypothetical protein